jgi:hypothetical protein
MPDEWEAANRLNARDGADGARIDAGGVSHLERYLDERSRDSRSPSANAK